MKVAAPHPKWLTSCQEKNPQKRKYVLQDEVNDPTKFCVLEPAGHTRASQAPQKRNAAREE